MMLKRMAGLMLVGLIATVLMPVAARAEFPDVPLDHWAYAAVDFLEEEGILSGYPDGTFKGDDVMTRYEFAFVVFQVYQNLMDMGEDEDYEPSIEVEAVVNMLMEEFEPEMDELMELIEANSERIDELEGTVGGFDNRIAEIGDKVDMMDARFHPFGDFRLRYYGLFPEEGMDKQLARYRLRWGFTSAIQDDFTLAAQFANGEIGGINGNDATLNDSFAYDDLVINYAYARWQPQEYPGFTMWGGKFTPMWMHTPLVWDPDVTVEGLAQYYTWEDWHFYLAEMVPADKGFYLLAQVGAKDLFIEGWSGAVTYHYVNEDCWSALAQQINDGNIRAKWDFSRLESPTDYRAIEFYGNVSHEIANIPFMLEGNYLMNLEDTAPGLQEEAGWQLAAFAKLTVYDSPKEKGDWNIWGEWGRAQPNSVLTWWGGSTRGGSDTEWFAGGWKYRLMRNTDFAVCYFNLERLSTEQKSDVVIVDVITKF